MVTIPKTITITLSVLLIVGIAYAVKLGWEALLVGIYLFAIGATLATVSLHTIRRTTYYKFIDWQLKFSQQLGQSPNSPVPELVTHFIGDPTLSTFAQKVETYCTDLLQKHTELESILNGIQDGIIAINPEQRILISNKSARHFAVGSNLCRGELLKDSIRYEQVHTAITRALINQELTTIDIETTDIPIKTFTLLTTPLFDAQEQSLGALLIFHDVTKLKKLEEVRRNFVANVSHELKTPITSIKGFVETLLDGALTNPEDARHFLNIIQRQSDRMSAIINDLLSLSQLERYSEGLTLPKTPNAITEIVASAIELCQHNAQQKQIKITSSCPPHLSAIINPVLLEQALVNLIDNAIKYSELDATVDIRVQTTNTEIHLSVADHGCGVPPEEHDRLFERFFRVEQGRSRKLGGTGLGLAIVKHIAIAHGGYPSVFSSPGKGSTFTIHIPLNKS